MFSECWTCLVTHSICLHPSARYADFTVQSGIFNPPCQQLIPCVALTFKYCSIRAEMTILSAQEFLLSWKLRAKFEKNITHIKIPQFWLWYASELWFWIYYVISTLLFFSIQISLFLGCGDNEEMYLWIMWTTDEPGWNASFLGKRNHFGGSIPKIWGGQQGSPRWFWKWPIVFITSSGAKGSYAELDPASHTYLSVWLPVKDSFCVYLTLSSGGKN